MRVLLVGNNPIELSEQKAKLELNQNQFAKVDFAFDLQGCIAAIKKFKPEIILIDDNLGKKDVTEISKSVHSLSEAPVALLKTSNYEKIALIDAEDYLMKDSLSLDMIQKSVANFLKIKSSAYYKSFRKKYEKGKNKMKTDVKSVIQKAIFPRTSLGT